MKYLSGPLIAFGALILSTSSFADSNFRYRYPLAVKTVAVSKPQTPVDPTNDWVTTDSKYGDWENVNGPYNCANWSPASDTIDEGIEFTQSANDCQQQQSRTIYFQKMNTKTGVVESDGEKTSTENQILTGIEDSRTATGTALAPIISELSGPDAILTQYPLTISWKTKNAISHELIGLEGNKIELGSSYDSYTYTPNISPPENGTKTPYAYWLNAKGSSGKTNTQIRNVYVYGPPKLENFKVNGKDSITVLMGTALNFTWNQREDSNYKYSSDDFLVSGQNTAKYPNTKTYSLSETITLDGHTSSDKSTVSVTSVPAAEIYSFDMDSDDGDFYENSPYYYEWEGKGLNKCTLVENVTILGAIHTTSYTYTDAVGEGMRVEFKAKNGQRKTTATLTCTDSYGFGTSSNRTATETFQDDG